MPLVCRLAAASSGTPSGPRISTSTSSQRCSESMRRPSMSKMDAPNGAAATVNDWPGPGGGGGSAGQVGGDRRDDHRVLGVGARAEAPDDLAGGGDQELLEVPHDVARLALGVGDLGQLGIDRVAAVAVHVDLLEEREGHAVGGRAELGDLLGRARLLAHELIAGESEDAEPLVPVGLLQPFQSLVLRREAALGGDVHEEERLPLVGRERCRLAGERVDRDVKEGHGRHISPPAATPERRPYAPTARPGTRRGKGKVPDMEAVVIENKELHWRERADPVPGDTELLVAVQAAG